MIWNFKMDDAPRNDKLITASKCGKVIVSYWLHKEQRWNMYSRDCPPIAWYCVFPSHPLVKVTETVDLDSMF